MGADTLHIPTVSQGDTLLHTTVRAHSRGVQRLPAALTRYCSGYADGPLAQPPSFERYERASAWDKILCNGVNGRGICAAHACTTSPARAHARCIIRPALYAPWPCERGATGHVP